MAHGAEAEPRTEKEFQEKLLSLASVGKDLDAINGLLTKFKTKGYDWRPGLGRGLNRVYENRGLEEFPVRQLDKVTLGGHSIIDGERIRLKEEILKHLIALSEEKDESAWAYKITPEEISAIEAIIKKENEYLERQGMGLPSSPDGAAAGAGGGEVVSREESYGSVSSLAAYALNASQSSASLAPLSSPAMGSDGSPLMLHAAFSATRSSGGDNPVADSDKGTTAAPTSGAKRKRGSHGSGSWVSPEITAALAAATSSRGVKRAKNSKASWQDLGVISAAFAAVEGVVTRSRARAAASGAAAPAPSGRS